MRNSCIDDLEVTVSMIVAMCRRRTWLGQVGMAR